MSVRLRSSADPSCVLRPMTPQAAMDDRGQHRTRPSARHRPFRVSFSAVGQNLLDRPTRLDGRSPRSTRRSSSSPSGPPLIRGSWLVSRSPSVVRSATRFQSMRSLVSGTRDGHRGHLDPQAAGCTVQRTRCPAPAPRRRPRPGSGRRQRRPPSRAHQAGEPQELRARSKPAAWSLSANHSPVSGEVPLPHSGYVHHRRRSQPEAVDRRTHPTCALGRGGMAPPGRLAAGARVPASGRELVGMTRGR
jgi:hypothetical protein